MFLFTFGECSGVVFTVVTGHVTQSYPHQSGFSHQQQRLQVAEVCLFTGQDAGENPLAHLQALLHVQFSLWVRRSEGLINQAQKYISRVWVRSEINKRSCLAS